MESPSLQFAAAVRAIGTSARELGLVVPAFRSPPRIPGAGRTLRRGADGAAVVSVAVRGRPFQAVVADLIEGVVLVNEVEGVAATRVRTDLWAAVLEAHTSAAMPGAA